MPCFKVKLHQQFSCLCSIGLCRGFIEWDVWLRRVWCVICVHSMKWEFNGVSAHGGTNLINCNLRKYVSCVFLHFLHLWMCKYLLCHPSIN